MDAVINLKHEPKLREAFEYAHVHNNTVLIDRRTKWGNPFQDRPRRHARRSHRALPRRSLAPHPRGRDRAGGTRGLGFLLARLPLSSEAVSRHRPGPRGGLGRRHPRGARCAAGRREPVMTGIVFRRIAPDESRIYDSTGCIIGEVYCQDDILKPGSHHYVVHLSEELPRSPPCP